jgi:hypothetical protein
MRLYAHLMLQASSWGNALVVQAMLRCGTLIKSIFHEAASSAWRYGRFQHPAPRGQVRLDARY